MAKSGKNSNVQTFAIFIWCFYSLDSSRNWTENHWKNKWWKHEYWLLIRVFLRVDSTFWSRNTKNNYWIRYSRKMKTANHESRKYPCTTLGHGTNKERESESLTFFYFLFPPFRAIPHYLNPWDRLSEVLHFEAIVSQLSQLRMNADPRCWADCTLTDGPSSQR